jgi:D-alanyl-D-alanine carboxypeptidase/D-alanyl-D-alanine-endopeptidase (penicillin-binding protein 4)
VARVLSTLALAAVAVGAGVGAVAAEADEPVEAVPAGPSATTPVLSPRRVPALLAAPAADRRLSEGLAGLLGRQPGVACLTVSSAGRALYLDDPDLPLVPASLVKLVTAVAALEVLGPDHVFRTALVAATPPVDGRITGDAWIVGGGDPVLATTDYLARFRNQPQTATLLEGFADGLVAAGVRAIDGRLLGDASRYDADRYPDAWPARFVDQDQSGPLSALTVNDGWVAFPPLPDLAVPDETPAADPAAHAAEVLGGQLAARGVTVGGTGAGPAPAGAVEVAAAESPPLTEIVGHLLRESDNQTAELLLKEIALARGRPPTTADGVAVANEVVAGLGLPVAGSLAVDGSGLGDGNLLSCALVEAILLRSGPESAIGRGLAVAGETGTLSRRFLGVEATGRLSAKTGTLNQVTSLAGFVDTIPGTSLSFAYIANLGAGDVVDAPDLALQDELAALLVRYPEGPPLGELAPRPPASGGDG